MIEQQLVAVNQLAERTETHVDMGFTACALTRCLNLATAWQRRCCFGATAPPRLDLDRRPQLRKSGPPSILREIGRDDDRQGKWQVAIVAGAAHV